MSFFSGSERQFQRSSTALTSGGGRGEGDGSGGSAHSSAQQHYSQAATTRYLIMRKATKKSLKVRVIFFLGPCGHTFCNLGDPK